MVSRLTYTLDCRDGERLSRFWAAALGYSCRGNFGAFWPLEAPASVDEPWLVRQQVPEPKTVKNRVHLDLHVDGDLDDEVRRLEALGARRADGAAVVMGGFAWVVMSDLEGNEFCVVRRPA